MHTEQQEQLSGFCLWQCFHDSYVSVRMEACIACSNLRINDPLVTEKLVFSATFDPIWKIKALALQGQYLGHVRSTLQYVCIPCVSRLLCNTTYASCILHLSHSRTLILCTFSNIYRVQAWAC